MRSGGEQLSSIQSLEAHLAAGAWGGQGGGCDASSSHPAEQMLDGADCRFPLLVVGVKLPSLTSL